MYLTGLCIKACAGALQQSTMFTFLARWVVARLLKDNQLNRLGVEDPYYEYVQQGSKTKKIKRKVPEGLSANDTKVLNDVRSSAYRYDQWFQLGGVKMGLSNFVSFVPVVGAVITNYWLLKLYMRARQLDDGLPLDLLLIFFFNIIIDFVLSLIPVIGSFIEIGYKANSRNFLLLERHLERVGQKNQGLIPENEVRPGFINDKVQPFVDTKIVPEAQKMGELIRHFVGEHLSSAEASVQSSDETATGTLEHDSDVKSVRSLKVHERAM